MGGAEQPKEATETLPKQIILAKIDRDKISHVVFPVEEGAVLVSPVEEGDVVDPSRDFAVLDDWEVAIVAVLVVALVEVLMAISSPKVASKDMSMHSRAFTGRETCAILRSFFGANKGEGYQ